MPVWKYKLLMEAIDDNLPDYDNAYDDVCLLAILGITKHYEHEFLDQD